MKSIDQQTTELKNKWGPVLLCSLALYLAAAVVAQKPLKIYFAAQGLDPSSALVQLLLMPLVLCLPLGVLYLLIYRVLSLRCPSCQVTVRRPTYRALERVHACPGCGCGWKETPAGDAAQVNGHTHPQAAAEDRSLS